MSTQQTREQIELLEESRDRLLNNAQKKRGYMNGSEKELFDEMEKEIRKMKMELPANSPLSRPLSQLPSYDGKGSRTSTGGPFKSFGEQMAAVMRAGLPGGETDQRLYDIRAASGLSESVPSDGGFLVQQDFSNELLRGVYDAGQVAKLCKRIPISGNSNGIKINAFDETSRVSTRYGGVVGYWVGEAAVATESKPKFRQIDLQLKKLVGLCYATDELLADSAALNVAIQEAFIGELSFRLDDAIINGLGTGQPLGILNAGCLVSVTKETGQKAATVVAENVIKMWSRVLAGSERTAVWLANKNVLPQLLQMSLAVGTGGVPLYMPANSVAGAPFQTLFGRPVIFVEQAATLGTVGDILLADLAGGYIIAEKGGIEQAMSIHVRFLFDESVFRFVMRVDGQPTLASALTPFKGTDALSHFVAIQTRA